MDIPLGADVVCAGKTCGRSIALVLNPVTDKVTHVVVREEAAPHEERLVPAESIARGDREELVLNTTRQELAKMEPFREVHFFRTEIDRYGPGMGYTWPYVTHAQEPVYLPGDGGVDPPRRGGGEARGEGRRLRRDGGEGGRVLGDERRPARDSPRAARGTPLGAEGRGDPGVKDPTDDGGDGLPQSLQEGGRLAPRRGDPAQGTVERSCAARRVTGGSRGPAVPARPMGREP